MKDKIIFLDFDGVLNSVRSASAFGGYPWNVNKDSLTMFDPIAIALIKKICKDYEVDIVLSSTWRLKFSIEELSVALDLPIVDKTPCKFSASRGEEIGMYLDSNKSITNYCIIDDDSDMLPNQLNRFVKTSPYEGFLFEDYVKTISILTNQEYVRGMLCER